MELVVRAYSTLESVPDMRIPNPGGIQYKEGGWINEHITRAYEAFRQASEYLGDFVTNQDSRRRLLPAWIARREK